MEVEWTGEWPGYKNVQERRTDSRSTRGLTRRKQKEKKTKKKKFGCRREGQAPWRQRFYALVMQNCAASLLIGTSTMALLFITSTPYYCYYDQPYFSTVQSQKGKPKKTLQSPTIHHEVIRTRLWYDMIEEGELTELNLWLSPTLLLDMANEAKCFFWSVMEN